MNFRGWVITLGWLQFHALILKRGSRLSARTNLVTYPLTIIQKRESHRSIESGFFLIIERSTTFVGVNIILELGPKVIVNALVYCHARIYGFGLNLISFFT